MNDFQGWLAEQMKSLNGKMDSLSEHMGRIDSTLVKNTSDIEHHISRSDAIQERVEQVASELRPITKHVERIKSIVWFLGALVAGWMTITKLFGG